MSGISGRLLGLFRHEQCGRQTLDFDDLAFFASGLRRLAVNGRQLQPLPDAFFFMAARHTVVEFDFGPDRRNWVMSLAGAALRPAPRDPWTVELARNGAWLPLPMIAPIPRVQVTSWLLEFDRLWEAQRNPLPVNVWRMELGVSRILGAILDNDASLHPVMPTPASQLKAWLDSDRLFNRNLADVCSELGYSDYHLRELFRRAYGVSPQVYRNRRRMAMAMDWITGSNLTLKEIAAQLKFRHFSHFSATFHRTFTLSPRTALRRYRFDPRRAGKTR